jgi:hypothetical protein
VIAVVMAVWARIAQADGDAGWVRLPAAAATVLTPLGLLLFALIGPLHSGWARKAGTPTTLLAKSLVPARTVVATPAKPSRPTAPAAPPAKTSAFSARVKGTVSQTAVTGGALIDISMRLIGSQGGRLRVRLAGAPIDGGGLSLTGSQVDLITNGRSSVMQGKVVSLQGTEFLAHLTDSAGAAMDVQAHLNINAQTNVVTGTVAGAPAGSGR